MKISFNKLILWRVYFIRGHAQWLIFPLTFGNVIIIWYSLFFERLNIFSNIYIFGFIFLSLYLPFAVIVGKWDFKHKFGSFQTEHELHSELSPVWKKTFTYLEDIKEILEENEGDE